MVLGWHRRRYPDGYGHGTVFTSWDALCSAALDVVKNPFLLGTAALAVLGVFVEPTSAGLQDEKKEG